MISWDDRGSMLSTVSMRQPPATSVYGQLGQKLIVPVHQFRRQTAVNPRPQQNIFTCATISEMFLKRLLVWLTLQIGTDSQCLGRRPCPHRPCHCRPFFSAICANRGELWNFRASSSKYMLTPPSRNPCAAEHIRK